MIRNIVALGPALVAVFAMSAVVAAVRSDRQQRSRVREQSGGAEVDQADGNELERQNRQNERRFPVSALRPRRSHRDHPGTPSGFNLE